MIRQFGVRDLSAFGCEDQPLIVGAAGALLQYLKETQQCALPHIQSIRIENESSSVCLDAASRRNLEIDYHPSGRPEMTLLGVIDRTVTAMGTRLIRRWLNQPIRQRCVLTARQDAIDELLNRHLHAPIREALRGLGDLERIAARIALRSVRPRDLSALRASLEGLPRLLEITSSARADLILEIIKQVELPGEIQDTVHRAIVAQPPVLIRDGGVFAEGFNAELDELRRLSRGHDAFLLELEQREKERTGLSNLKIGFNRVQGFYLELSRLDAPRVPADYIRRQTLKGVERYITPELKEFEDKILGARERSLALEKLLWEKLIDELTPYVALLQKAGAALATFDVLSNLAQRAETLGWQRPILDDRPGIDIEAGRHPVVESMSREPFVPNDLVLDPSRRMLIITGPNMGGKSTYMRQTAVIALLAHIGSFVPATKARLGPLDRIFTRIGASDDLASGRSTFMVEMTETAHILHHASANSLVLMDEIGRGTSTFDGLSLAFATAEHLARVNRAMTLFATHYFELITLPEEFPEVANVHLDAAEHQNGVVFLHTVKEGAANQSYGLEVAALAGVPRTVIQRAREKLGALEANTIGTRIGGDPENASSKMEINPALQLLANIDPNLISPRESLDLLFQLKHLSGLPEQTSP